MGGFGGGLSMLCRETHALADQTHAHTKTKTHICRGKWPQHNERQTQGEAEVDIETENDQFVHMREFSYSLNN